MENLITLTSCFLLCACIYALCITTYFHQIVQCRWVGWLEKLFFVCLFFVLFFFNYSDTLLPNLKLTGAFNALFRVSLFSKTKDTSQRLLCWEGYLLALFQTSPRCGQQVTAIWKTEKRILRFSSDKA